MRYLLIAILVIFPVTIRADDHCLNGDDEDRVIFITVDNDTLMLTPDGRKVPIGPYVLCPIEVWEQRNPGPATCFIAGDLFISHSIEDDSWEKCYNGGDWEAMQEPTLAVLRGALLQTGDFISSDDFHTVEAVIEDIPKVEQWQSIAQNGYSGRLTFNPKTAKEPTITFHVNDVNQNQGRGGPLSYIVRAKVGPLTTDSPVFEQNALHRLRQEYVDLNQTRTPDAEDFDEEAPAYFNLADPDDTHDHHEDWRILEMVNEKARDLKNATEINFMFPSGFRCPVRNRNLRGAARNSEHIYGRALDFDVIVNSDSLNTAQLYILWEILHESDDRPFELWLYDQNGRRIRVDNLPAHPLMPPGVTQYTKGHAAWN